MITTTEFSIVSINTWKCDGNYRQRIALLKKALEALNPDVVLCQEVFKTADSEFDTGTILATHLDMECYYSASRSKDRMLEGVVYPSFSGLCILSKYPFIEKTRFALPSVNEDGERIAQLVKININNQPICLINTHLTHLRNASVLRTEQLTTILSKHKNNFPCFLGGDMNALEDAPEITFLQENTHWKITDTFRNLNPEKEGFTVPAKRIDYLFFITSREETSSAVTLTNAEVVLNRPDDSGVFPSDHFGVMVKAKIEK